MFGKLTNMIDNALTVGGSIMTGEMPTQRQVAQLIADGIGVAVIAAMFGVGIEVIEELVEGSDHADQ
jgi:hypothetical protein